MWDQIRANKRRSAFVVALIGVLLVATGMSVGVLVVGDDAGLLLGGPVALGIWLIMWLITISQGDQILLRMAGAREIHKQDLPQLVNVVEEMSIASALGTTPRVFVVDDPAPNAFATGRNRSTAAVAVTTGLLHSLDRNELQGVVAHEIGHIKNRDVALMTTAGIMIGAIVLMAEVGMRILWFGGARRSRSSSNGGGGQAQLVIMAVAILFMILAPILAQIVYFALSRRREYLADASAALYTRYPEGLASALEKISGIARPLADESRVTAPMYIVQPLRKAQSGKPRRRASLFSTHPPIAERVHILRSMAGGVGLRDYEEAFQKVKHKRLLSDRGRREAQAFEVELARAAPALAAAEARPVAGRREIADAMLSASGYKKIPCGNCGALLKVPPSVAGKLTRCPRCRASL